MLTDVQFPDAAKTGPVFKPELCAAGHRNRQQAEFAGNGPGPASSTRSGRTAPLPCAVCPSYGYAKPPGFSMVALTSLKLARPELSGRTNTRTIRSSPLANDIAW